MADEKVRSASTVVARLIARRALRWGALWGLAFGFYIAASATGFKALASTPAARAKLAQTLGANRGMAVLIGPAFRIDTVGGFTAWRSLGVLGLLGGIIGLLFATKVLRGEEEAGRWELLLAGSTTRSQATAQSLAGLGAGVLGLYAVTATIAVIGCRIATPALDAPGILTVSLVSVSTTAVFIAVGALASQLAVTRRQAASLAGVVFGAAFLVRAAADSASGLRWARWLSPLGWPSLFHAFTGNDPAALVPPAIAVIVIGCTAVAVAGRRDVGAAALPDRDHAASHTGLLAGQAGLAVRLTRGVASGWAAALAIGGLFLGLIAEAASESVSGSGTVSTMLARLGAHGSGARSYLGLAFLSVATMVSFAGASVVNATREEEATGRLDNLFVRPVGRTAWLATRIGVAAGLTVACGLIAGVATWIGTATQHTGIGFSTLVGAGLNTVPPALLLVGLGTFAHGVAPRSTTVATYAVLGWAFLVEMIGSMIKMNHWLLDTSIFRHMTLAPAADPNWRTAAVLVGLGVAIATAGTVAFGRRDLASA